MNNLIKPGGEPQVKASKLDLLNMVKQQALANKVLQYLLHSQLPEDGAKINVPLDKVDEPFTIDVDVKPEDNTIEVKRMIKQMNDQVNQVEVSDEEKKKKEEKPVESDEGAPATM